MRLLRIFEICLLISVSLFANTVTDSKSVKITGEKWFNWNGSEWIISQDDDYVLDSLGNVEKMIRYTYNSSGYYTGTKTFLRTDYQDYYTLRYYYSWSGDREWGHYSYTYKYDFNGTKTGYISNYYYDSEAGGEEGTITFTYTYEGDKITVIDEVSDFSMWKKDGDPPKWLNYIYRTTFNYDSFGRITSELKTVSYDQTSWADKERTVWTYDGNIGTGINEIYKNTVWIFQNKKTRTLNGSYQPSFENRNAWSWGYWINSETDDLVYSEGGNLTEVITRTFNSETGNYNNSKKRTIIYNEPTGITEIPLSDNYELFQNYPNPFNPVTTINYALPQASLVELNVYNLQGQLVQSLVNGRLDKGIHKAEFNGNNFTSGLYQYRLSVDNKVVSSKKMMMLK